MDIGKRIRYYREQTGYSQKQLGELLFMGERTIGHYETGFRIPPIDKLSLIAGALEVDIEDLLKESTKEWGDWNKWFFDEVDHFKNMDERRFKMIVQRLNENGEPISKEKIMENSQEISVLDEYKYDKKLAHSLLSLSNPYIIFTKIWMTYPFVWEIDGMIGKHLFHIRIHEKGDSIYVNAKHLFEKVKRSTEYKQILLVIRDWIKEKFPSKKVLYNLAFRLYCDELTKEEVGDEKISKLDFSDRIVNALKHIPTVKDLFLLSESEIKAISQIGTTSFYQIVAFKEMVISRLVENEWANFVELHKEEVKTRKTPEELDKAFNNLFKRMQEGNFSLGERRPQEEVEHLMKEREEKLRLKEERKRLFS